MERDDERYVRELFEQRFDLTMSKMPESTVSGQKTADYEVRSNGERAAVLEVKRLELTPRTPENGWVKDGVFNRRDRDNGPTRVGRCIHAAWKQLGQYDDPKVLVFVNDETLLDVDDLHEAFNGSLPYGTEGMGYFLNTASKKIAAGIIREEKGRIDLYIWLDRHYGTGKMVMIMPVAGQKPVEEFRDQGPYFRPVTPVGGELVRKLFGGHDLPPFEDQAREQTP